MGWIIICHQKISETTCPKGYWPVYNWHWLLICIQWLTCLFPLILNLWTKRANYIFTTSVMTASSPWLFSRHQLIAGNRHQLVALLSNFFFFSIPAYSNHYFPELHGDHKQRYSRKILPLQEHRRYTLSNNGCSTFEQNHIWLRHLGCKRDDHYCAVKKN